MHSQLFFLFLLFITFSFHPCSSQKNNQYKSCAPLPFSCGNFNENITFPFSINRTLPGCGLPALHLSCTTDNLTLLIMNDDASYQVKKIDYEKQIMTIADMAFINIDKYCSYLSNPSLDFSLFDYTNDYHNLTYYGCSIPLNRSSSGFFELCNTSTNYEYYYYFFEVLDPTLSEWLGDNCVRYLVPIGKPYSMNDLSMDGLMKALADGFNVTWNPGKDWCDKCVGSGGRCGLDESKPNDLLCLCPDATYSDASCHASESFFFSNPLLLMLLFFVN
ncbi:hypothetical protein QJS10_CPB14g00444 [Acorus calamus]|uniref:Uncharacterized protein n=1 Tax=Acorus calamus TaxID=4465 RepID=A0AAV9DAU1_ACOCL|nr:hypothetical protein QJS10_CPB14g00444 [Acorus calamus]